MAVVWRLTFYVYVHENSQFSLPFDVTATDESLKVEIANKYPDCVVRGEREYLRFICELATRKGLEIAQRFGEVDPRIMPTISRDSKKYPLAQEIRANQPRWM